jgi:hypothetical protein
MNTVCGNLKDFIHVKDSFLLINHSLADNVLLHVHACNAQILEALRV